MKVYISTVYCAEISHTTVHNCTLLGFYWVVMVYRNHVLAQIFWKRCTFCEYYVNNT